MILESGEKVHIIERLYFERDIRRHFVGEVVQCTERAIRAKGYVFVFDQLKAVFNRKPEKRERVIFPNDRTVINVIPKDVVIDDVKYIYKADSGLTVTDGKQFSLNLSEFVANR